MKATKATEQKKHEIQRSNLLIEASYNIPSVDGYRIALIGMSNACINLLNNPDDEAALTVAIKTKELQALFPAFKKAQGSIHKRIDQATDSIGRNNMVKVLNKDKGNWRKIPFIMDIEYRNSNLLLIRFNEEIRPLFNPQSEFTRYLINDTAKLRSYQQIRVYELCCQYITVGSRAVEVTKLKQFIGVKQNKTNSKLIEELNSCISQINNKTNLKVEFETLKTSRKITHIKFTFCRKDLHPLDGINQENQKKQISDASNASNTNDTSNIKAQLTALGFKKAKLPSLLKIPTEVLLRAITATKKAKTKGFKKTMEACFFFQVGIFKRGESDDDTNTTTKIEPIQLVHLFKDTLSIETMKALWDEFYAQLSEGQKNAYSASNREKNTTVKEALDHDFNNKYNRWIYEAKIKQG
jgi:plasmid replication initiation protein